MRARRGVRRGGRAPPGARRTRAGAGRSSAPTRSTAPPSLFQRTGRRRHRDRQARASAHPRRGRRAPAAPSRRCSLKGARPLAGQLVHAEQRRARRSRRSRSTTARGGDPRGVDGLQGRVDDGARLRRRVRAQGQRAVRVDPAARSRSSCRSSTRAGRCGWLHLDVLVLAGFSVVVRVLQRTANIDTSVPLASPLLAYLLGAHARGSACAAGARAGRRRRSLVPTSWLAIGDRLPRRLPRRAERHRLERHRRRLLGGDRRRPHGRRRPALRQLAEGQRARRHVRPGGLRGVRAVRACCCRGRASGTTCPPRTARRSSSTCSTLLGSSCSAGASAGRRSASSLAYAWAAYPFTLFALNTQRERQPRDAAHRRARCSSRAARPRAGR